MAAQLFYLPFRPALDMNALAIPGAQLYFYVSGGLTLGAIYAEEALTTPLANPVVADSAGRWPAIYLNSAIVYRVVLKDSTGTTIPGHDIDPYIPGVSDAVTSSVQDILDDVVEYAASAAANADLAEDARDVAQAAVGVDYQSEALALAGATNGDRFTYWSGDSIVFAKKEGGVVVTLAGPWLSPDKVGVASTAFVDSANGSDSNDGTLRSAAKQTLTNADGNEITLLTDSLWREELALTAAADVLATGCGQPAIISGADVVTSWIAEGTANVWQKTNWTHSVGSGSDRFLITEDGEVLTRVANVATCSSTAGSFVDVRASAGSPVTLKIHPTGSGNPNTNGKTYEATRRYTALSSSNAVFVKGPIETTAAVGNNGSFVMTGHGDVCSVLATYGTKHNFFLGSGKAFGCTAYFADKPTSDEVSNTMFVSYKNTPAGFDYSYENCGGVQPSSVGSAYSGTLAFYAHGNSGSYDSGTMVQCWGLGPIFGGHAGGAGTISDLGNYWRAMSFTSNPTATNHKIDQMVAYIYQTLGGVSAQTTFLNGHELENCGVYFELRGAADSVAMRTDGGANVLDRSTLVMGGDGTFNAHAFGSIATSGSFTCNNSVIAGFSGNLLNVPSGVTYTGNNNVFWCDNEFATTDGFEGVWHGTGYSTLAAWQTATGQDSNSVYAVKADQVAGDADALFLGWKEAAAGTSLDECGPAVGDFRLNPTAKVYNGAGVLKTGTLADGTTPITSVGQQFHRDWNRRASATGPATAFPAVPETLDELREHTRSPLTWRF